MRWRYKNRPRRPSISERKERNGEEGEKSLGGPKHEHANGGSEGGTVGAIFAYHDRNGRREQSVPDCTGTELRHTRTSFWSIEGTIRLVYSIGLYTLNGPQCQRNMVDLGERKKPPKTNKSSP